MNLPPIDAPGDPLTLVVLVAAAVVPAMLLVGQGIAHWLTERVTGKCSRCGQPLPPKAGQ